MADTALAEHPKMTGPLRRRWSVYFGYGALLFAGLFAGIHLSSWPLRLRYPGEVCFIEGTRRGEMEHVRQGIPIYATGLAEHFGAASSGCPIVSSECSCACSVHHDNC